MLRRTITRLLLPAFSSTAPAPGSVLSSSRVHRLMCKIGSLLISILVIPTVEKFWNMGLMIY